MQGTKTENPQPVLLAARSPVNNSFSSHHVVERHEGVVDGDDVHIGVVDGGAEHNTANAAEARGPDEQVKKREKRRRSPVCRT